MMMRLPETGGDRRLRFPGRIAPFAAGVARRPTHPRTGRPKAATLNAAATRPSRPPPDAASLGRDNPIDEPAPHPRPGRAVRGDPGARAGRRAGTVDRPAAAPGLRPAAPAAPPAPAPRPVVATSERLLRGAAPGTEAQHVEVQGVAPATARPPRPAHRRVQHQVSRNERVASRCAAPRAAPSIVSKSSLDRVAGATPQARRETALRAKLPRRRDLTK